MSQQISMTIDVADLTGAMDFYVEALSCDMKKKYSDGWAVVAADGVNINLVEQPAGSVAAADHKRSYQRHWTPVHLDFGVADVPAAMELVKKHGGTVEGHVTSDGSDFAHCADPFGNGFCLVKT